MIYVDRIQVPYPKILSMKEKDSPAYIELQKATKFFKDAARKNIRNRQERFEFRAAYKREIKEALFTLFHEKCAYCETKLPSPRTGDLEMYRPKSTILESPDHPGYWWLAMRWENLLFSCPDCNRVHLMGAHRAGKANRFPLKDEKKRAFRPEDDLNKEQPLILDPCDPLDKPEKHLVFDEATGTVYSDTDRGQTTITVLGLNRARLVEARRKVAEEVRSLIHLYELTLVKKSVREKDVQRLVNRVRAETMPYQEFAALRRQIITKWKSEKTAHDKSRIEKLFPSLEQNIDLKSAVTKERERHAKKSFQEFEHRQASYSLETKKGQDTYRDQSRVIEHIKINNIKAIRSLELDLIGKTGQKQWFMLLGENSTGKSTVLHSAALVLLGSRSFVRLSKDCGLHPKDFLRYRCKQGSVEVKLSGFPNPHKLVFREDRLEFTSPTGEKTSVVFNGTDIVVEGAGWGPQMMLLGYGATRLLPRKGTKTAPKTSKEFSRVDNLFDPFVALIDAEKWLLALNDKGFRSTAKVLRDLMSLKNKVRILSKDGKMVVVNNRASVPLRQLSDGYQSMFAMTVDILEIALRLWPNLENAEGIILLDELGAHLHPAWKMRVVDALREALPHMQFIVTTHDPLCLRGLGEGEVAVMQRDENGQVIALTDLPSPSDYKIDQLLTSPFFGLDSTRDPDLEDLFDEYYKLLAKPEPTAEEKVAIAKLRGQLDEKRQLGETFREGLVYDVVDRLLAEQKKEPLKISMDNLRQSVIDDVRKAWERGAPGQSQ